MSVAPPRNPPSKRNSQYQGKSTSTTPGHHSPTIHHPDLVTAAAAAAASNYGGGALDLSDNSTPLEKTSSFVNLTSSSLKGLFGSSASLADLAGDNPSPRRNPNLDRLNPNNIHKSSLHKNDDTLKNTTTNKGLDLDEANRLLEKPSLPRHLSNRTDNSIRQTKKYLDNFNHRHKYYTKASRWSFVYRVAFLFLFGVIYGQFAKNLRDNQSVKAYIFNIEKSALLFSLSWGIQAISLGFLLPYIDKLLPKGSNSSTSFFRSYTSNALFGGSNTVGENSGSGSTRRPSSMTSNQSISSGGVVENDLLENSDDDDDEDSDPNHDSKDKSQKGGTDWVSITRATTAFLGLAYGVRKLPWESSWQVSFLWGCINPFLWYLLDGTRNGFLMSSTTSIIETGGFAFVMRSNIPETDTFSDYMSVMVWIASVFFSCSICFGNLGRRLFSFQ